MQLIKTIFLWSKERPFRVVTSKPVSLIVDKNKQYYLFLTFTLNYMTWQVREIWKLFRYTFDKLNTNSRIIKKKVGGRGRKEKNKSINYLLDILMKFKIPYVCITIFLFWMILTPLQILITNQSFLVAIYFSFKNY